VTADVLRHFYGQTLENILAYLQKVGRTAS